MFNIAQIENWTVKSSQHLEKEKCHISGLIPCKSKNWFYEDVNKTKITEVQYVLQEILFSSFYCKISSYVSSSEIY